MWSSAYSSAPQTEPSTTDDTEPSVNSQGPEQVMLDTSVFKYAVKELRLKRLVGVFVSRTHHQLPCLNSTTSNPVSVGTNALGQNWQAKATPYINQPLFLISPVLKKC